MAEAVDLIKEFKSAKPPEKAVIILGVAAVGGVAFYLWRKGSAAATTATTAQGQTGGQAAGFPTTVNGTPVLPAGVNPVFDQNGNLIAFQNQPPPAPPPPPVQTGPSQNQLTTQQLLKGESFRPVPPLPKIVTPTGMIASNTMVTKTANKKRVV